MNKKQAKQRALEVIIATMEGFVQGGDWLNLEEKEVDCEKVKDEINKILDQLQIKREKFAG